MNCPRPSCQGERMHRVYYGRGKTAWRCMRCNTVYTFREILPEVGEPGRVSIWSRNRGIRE